MDFTVKHSCFYSTTTSNNFGQVSSFQPILQIYKQETHCTRRREIQTQTSASVTLTQKVCSNASCFTCCSIIACCCCSRAWSWGGDRICCICCGVIIWGDIIATDTGTYREKDGLQVMSSRGLRESLGGGGNYLHR